MTAVRRDPFRAAKLLLVLATAVGVAQMLSMRRAPQAEKTWQVEARIVRPESSASESALQAEREGTTHEAP